MATSVGSDIGNALKAESKPHTVTSLVALAASSTPDKEAITVAAFAGSSPTVVTYKHLQEEVDRLAGALVSSGIQPGDLVSLAFPNTLEFVICFLSILRARAVANPLNSAYTEEEFKFYLEDAHAKLLLLPADAAATTPAAAAAQSLSIPILTASKWSGEGLTLTSGGTEEQAGAQAAGAAAPSAPPPPPTLPLPSDEALFLHTSGTTSRPKGVPLTQANLASSVHNIIGTYDLSPSDRTYVVMPLFHVHGLMAALLSSLATSGGVVLPAGGKFSASAFWGDVAKYGVTWYTAVPTMHQILLARHKAAVSASSPGGPPSYPPLRFIRSCSASLAPSVLHDMEAVFGAPVLEAYAMTEASHQMTSNPLPGVGAHKPGTVGKATGIELAILDEQGRVLPAGSTGEVCIRGANVTLGYKNNAAANEAAFAFGWFHTGDQGVLDGEGYLTLTGRLKELINRGGEKISPLEVDAALLSHPCVAEAVAFAAPDSHYGEEVNAAVVLHEGVRVEGQTGEDSGTGRENGTASDAKTISEADIVRFLKQKMAPFKVPKRIFFADTLPRTATGKIQRRFVAQHFLEKAKT